MTRLNYEKQKKIDLGRNGISLRKDKNPGMKYRGNKRTNLKVPYAEKNYAKCLGARWDAENKTWYCVGNNKKFRQWM